MYSLKQELTITQKQKEREGCCSEHVQVHQLRPLEGMLASLQNRKLPTTNVQQARKLRLLGDHDHPAGATHARGLSRRRQLSGRDPGLQRCPAPAHDGPPGDKSTDAGSG
uniref:(northern house mosquito) hypothetical protein n=1 Tax=Culex pipiens TaxID=7175 RepID=A0A8D8A7J7_CULPI